MTKKLKIGIVLTGIFLIVWLITAFTYSVVTNMKVKDDLPPYLLYPVVCVFGIWVLIGIFLTIKYYLLIKKELIKFINEK